MSILYAEQRSSAKSLPFARASSSVLWRFKLLSSRLRAARSSAFELPTRPSPSDSTLVVSSSRRLLRFSSKSISSMFLRLANCEWVQGILLSAPLKRHGKTESTYLSRFLRKFGQFRLLRIAAAVEHIKLRHLGV